MASSLTHFSGSTVAAGRHSTQRIAKIDATPRTAKTLSSKFAVRSEAEGAAAPAKPAPFKPPTLDASTPSPIFGGSTGGLLRKAQVRFLNTNEIYRSTTG